MSYATLYALWTDPVRADRLGHRRRRPDGPSFPEPAAHVERQGPHVAATRSGGRGRDQRDPTGLSETRTVVQESPVATAVT